MPQVSQRVADLLNALRAAPSARLATELAFDLRLSAPACQRLLASALDSGFITEEGEPPRYRLSPRLWGWGIAATLEAQQIIEAARPRLIDGARGIDETLLLSVRDGRDVVFMEAATRRHDVVVVEPIAASVRVHACASGKAMLAHLAPEDLDTLLSAPLEPVTDATITAREALQAEFTNIRRAGYAVSRREAGEYAGIAVPVFDAEGQPVAAVSVAGPATDDGVRHLESLALVLRHLAETLSEALGYERPAAVAVGNATH